MKMKNEQMENELLKRLDLSKCKIDDSNFKKYVKELLLKKLDTEMETCFLFCDKVNLAEIVNNNANKVVIGVDLSLEQMRLFSNIFNCVCRDPVVSGYHVQSATTPNGFMAHFPPF